MENLIFIKLEIFIFIFSFLYILYYLWTKFFVIYFKLKKAINPEKIKNKKSALNKVSLNSSKRETSLEEKDKSKWNVSEIDKNKVTEILKRVKINSSKWYFDTAKNLIVEWLSLDKYSKELNLELASIYEQEKKYSNAEYIYKDLLDNLKVDFEVMKKLWYIYAMQNKLKDALNIYEKLHNKKMADDKIIDFLSDLTFDMKEYKKALKYTNLFLLCKPRDVNKLFIKAESLEKLKQNKSALDIYKRILELQPYNNKAKSSLIELQKLINET